MLPHIVQVLIRMDTFYTANLSLTKKVDINYPSHFYYQYQIS